MSCVVDADPINYLTPITSIFLHGSWTHIAGSSLICGVRQECRRQFLGWQRAHAQT
jgi:hypothetical protein